MDQQLLFFINRTVTHPALDWLMAVMSSFDFWWPLLVAGGVIGVIFGGFRFRAFLVAMGIAIGITDGLVVDTLKGLVGRPRPNEMLEGVRSLDLQHVSPRFLAVGHPLRQSYSVARIQPPHGNSFPSGHASNNFALATVAALFYRRRGWLVYLPATLVAYSRVYVGSHWPSDVVVSALIGTGIAFLVCAGLEKLWAALGPRWVPALHERHPFLLAA
jgi:undecaprenyl-diphosphatase